MSRKQLKQDFLEKSGWSDAAITPMGSDASKRSYDRLERGKARAVLMNAPYEAGEDVRSFLNVTTLLRSAGHSAPEILARDEKNGFILLEDLGDGLYADHINAKPESETELYGNAIDLLAGIDTISVAGLKPYDETAYMREAMLFLDWYMPIATGEPLRRDKRAMFNEALAVALRSIPEDDAVITLRDFHAENLIWLPERIGTQRVGLLDYQDALCGHPAYDLVSFLEDARRDTSTTLQKQMYQRYLEKSGKQDAEFRQAYDVLGAQRNLKIVGIFTRLCCRDNKKTYPDLIPRVWGHLIRDLTHPCLSDLANWIAEYAPEPTPKIIERIKDHDA